MKKESRMEQHFAVSKEGRLCHITEAHNNQEDFYCPHCGCRMLKKCGDIRTWHFAHDPRSYNEFQKKCYYESYLHAYAKLRFKQWFDKSNSIMLHYRQGVVCKLSDICKLHDEDECINHSTDKCDLKKHFDTCKVEAPVKEDNGCYRADLLLESNKNPNNRLLLEINVSHRCTNQKKTSNAKIIEFDVSSEEDIEYIVSHDIRESEKVRYYNFRIKTKKGVIWPKLILPKFILYRSRKFRVDSKNSCLTIKSHHRSSIFEITVDEIVPSRRNYWLLGIFGLMEAKNQGIEIHNCYLCENSCYLEDLNCCGCKIKKEKIAKAHDALNCKSFKYSPNLYNSVMPESLPFTILDTRKYI